MTTFIRNANRDLLKDPNFFKAVEAAAAEAKQGKLPGKDFLRLVDEATVKMTQTYIKVEFKQYENDLYYLFEREWLAQEED